MPSAMDAILKEARKAAEEVVADQLATVINGLKQGRPINELLPDTIQVVADKKEDAKERAWRTFLQNLLIDMLVTVGTVLITALATLDISSKEAWIGLAILLGKTALSAPIAYIMRMKKEPHAVEISSPTTLVAAKMSTPTSGEIPLGGRSGYHGRG